MPDTFATRLRLARKSRDMTQAELSRVSGVPAINISIYERGLSEPMLFSAVSLADALRVSLDWLTCRNMGRRSSRE